MESYRHRVVCYLFHEGGLLCLLAQPVVTEGLKEKVMEIKVLYLSSEHPGGKIRASKKMVLMLHCLKYPATFGALSP